MHLFYSRSRATVGYFTYSLYVWQVHIEMYGPCLGAGGLSGMSATDNTAPHSGQGQPRQLWWWATETEFQQEEMSHVKGARTEWRGCTRAARD